MFKSYIFFTAAVYFKAYFDMSNKIMTDGSDSFMYLHNISYRKSCNWIQIKVIGMILNHFKYTVIFIIALLYSE